MRLLGLSTPVTSLHTGLMSMSGVIHFIGVGAPSVNLEKANIFVRIYMDEIINRMPEFYIFLSKKYFSDVFAGEGASVYVCYAYGFSVSWYAFCLSNAIHCMGHNIPDRQ